MKKLKLSQWHDGSVKPVHDGVYQRKFFCWLEYLRYSKFYRGKWYWYGHSVASAESSNIISEHIASWRGVVK